VRQDGLPDALVPEGPFRLPGRRPADAIPPAPPASDASVAALLDEAAGAVLPALADVRYAEKLAAPALVVRALASELHLARLPPEVAALYIPGAVRSAA
jgi:hypothetical protein